jgi:hypothetical protein
MGTEIRYQDFLNISTTTNRLLLYYKKIQELQHQPVSISKRLAEKLLDIRPRRRSMRLEQCFNEVLSELPDGVIVRDFDVMFNPDYQVDVLKILTEARRHKEYSAIWPGEKKDGKLIYGEEGYPDYKTYEIENYDITCII